MNMSFVCWLNLDFCVRFIPFTAKLAYGLIKCRDVCNIYERHED